MMTPEKRKKICHQLVSTINANTTFFLSGHHTPDGDTVASELAMASLLKRLGKKVDIYNAAPVPESLMFLPGTKTIKTSRKVTKHYDVAIVFECVNEARMGNLIKLDTQAKTVINIDHHLKHSFFGDINFVNVHASSNSEQLFYVFEAFKMPINKAEAACLYTGIIADTGRFQYSNTNPETLRIASHLLACGAQPHVLSEALYGKKSYPATKLLAIALNNLKLTADKKIAYIELTPADFARANAAEDETDEIVNYGTFLPGVLMSILFRKFDNASQIKVSFRSKLHVNVCALSEQFGGGGHKYAAGCKLNASLKKAVPIVLRAAQKSI